MANGENHESGNGKPPGNHNGKGQSKGPGRHAPKDASLAGNEKLIERVRQIISETPEIRPEKVGPLLEAVKQGTYSINVRKLANILITNLFLDP
jgi:anti-sigma28 factor (negative regulator of flagellin synthesis)